jgi:hypothetical protein
VRGAWVDERVRVRGVWVDEEEKKIKTLQTNNIINSINNNIALGTREKNKQPRRKHRGILGINLIVFFFFFVLE